MRDSLSTKRHAINVSVGAAISRLLSASWLGRYYGADQLFDQMAETLGRGIPRRKAFKLILGGLIGAALAESSVKSSWATTSCLCAGVPYDPETQCCEASIGFAVQPKYPIKNLAACASKVPHPYYVPTANGCGPEGSVLTPLVPNHFGHANLTFCCNAHDVCYGICNNYKNIAIRRSCTVILMLVRLHTQVILSSCNPVSWLPNCTTTPSFILVAARSKRVNRQLAIAAAQFRA